MLFKRKEVKDDVLQQDCIEFFVFLLTTRYLEKDIQFLPDQRRDSSMPLSLQRRARISNDLPSSSERDRGGKTLSEEPRKGRSWSRRGEGIAEQGG